MLLDAVLSVHTNTTTPSRGSRTKDVHLCLQHQNHIGMCEFYHKFWISFNCKVIHAHALNTNKCIFKKKNLPNKTVDTLTSNKLVDLAASGASPHFRSMANKMFNLSCIIYNLQRLS